MPIFTGVWYNSKVLQYLDLKKISLELLYEAWYDPGTNETLKLQIVKCDTYFNLGDFH